MNKFFTHLTLLSCLLLSPSVLAADASGKVFYRYVNSDGVKVMNHTLPAEYAQKGYEVVSLTGQIIKKVAPAVTGEEAARLAAENRTKAELAEWDKRLRRRYSSVADIESAKQRKLASIDTSISILDGNIDKLKQQLQVQQGQAANVERAGRQVPKTLLDNITNLELEVKVSQEQAVTRREERQQTVDKYDKDIERFREISPSR